eukprot:5008580-Heterocapsa_arctica.AAC.1
MDHVLFLGRAGVKLRSEGERSSTSPRSSRTRSAGDARLHADGRQPRGHVAGERGQARGGEDAMP